MGVQVKDVFSTEFLRRYKLRFVSGAGGLSRELQTSRIQKPGLLLTGLLKELHSDRVQIFGEAEIGYLKSLPAGRREETLELLEKSKLPAIVVTKAQEVPDFLEKFSARNGLPLYVTELSSSIFIDGVSKLLEEILAPTTQRHGVLVDVLGVGILLTGKSGIGKSECALDLVSKGYRLVSDDMVVIKRIQSTLLFGSSPDLSRYHMEIRGLGIVNIKDLYGITAIRKSKQMDLVVELVRWEPDSEYERVGVDEKTYDILDVSLPYLRVPVSSGRSVATIVEVAARNQILKIMGKYSARTFVDTLGSELQRPPEEKVGN